MRVQLVHPEALFALAFVPCVWLLWHRSMMVGGAALSDFPRWQRRAVLAARSLLVGLVVLALAGPEIVRQQRAVSVVILVDESPSMDAAQHQAAEALVERVRRATPRWGRVVVRPFAGDAPQTDLAEALRLGTALVPADASGRLLLISDGNETLGDALAAAREAAALGLRLFTATPEPSPHREALVQSVTAPAAASPGATVELLVRLESTHDQEANLALDRGDFRIGVQPVRLAAQGVTKARVEADVGSSGPALFTVTCDAPLDTRLDNNAAKALTMVRGRPRVLLVEASPNAEQWLRRALAAEEMEVVQRPAAGIPALAELNGFDCVILSDVPATAFELWQMEALAAYVRDLGGGLVMVGGENSFGPGGYYGTPIAALLPVRLETPQREEVPGIALVLAIDRSGSMNAEQKIELAKDAAKAAAEVLSPGDQVAVVTFSGASHVLLPLSPVRDKARLAGAIAQLTASGGTSIAPALMDAHRLLSEARAKLKHVILLSDGRTSPGDFETLTAQMTADHITVSTVAIGAGADTDLLRQIAQWGGGRAYFTADPFNIPQILTTETLRAAQRAFAETPFQPRVLRPAPVIRGLDFAQAPLLLGCSLTQPRAGAETILVTDCGDPLLARWRYGLGTVTAFTADAKNRWAAEWLEAPIYGRFWTQVVRDAMRSEAAGRWHLASVLDGPRARLTLDALDLDDEFANDLSLEARVLDPLHRSSTAPFRQTAPGRYEAGFAVDAEGAYAIQTVVFPPAILRAPHPQMGTRRQSASEDADSPGPVLGPGCGLIQPGSREMRTLAADSALMKRIAAVGGGREVAMVDEDGLDDLFDPGGAAATRRHDLWPLLVAAALVTLCVDVFLKRIRLPERRAARRAPT